MKAANVMAAFQFYDSTIKSTFAQRNFLCAVGFNSTIVRLKVSPSIIKNPALQSFNSTIVRLKGPAGGTV